VELPGENTLQVHKTAIMFTSASQLIPFRNCFLKPFKTLDMKKLTTLLNASEEQVQETLLVTAIMAVIVTVAVLFI
jgi:hypothetical protein